MADSQVTRQMPVVDEETPLIPTLKDDQYRVLSRKKLLIVFPAIAFAQFTSYLDQTAISTAIPAIANGVHAGSSISWIGASFMTSSTSFQLINGRLSDIFGRKLCLITAVGLLGFGNLLSGFCVTPLQLYLTRAVSGVGAGAINTLVQISISDITTLEQRGRYNGFIGAFVALGNGLGPVVGGILTERLSWRWAFWFISPMTALAMINLYLVVPDREVSGHTWDKLKMIDWSGVILNLAAVLLILIPISQGGAAFPWNSPIVISTLSIGVALAATFVLVEFRYAKLPMMPLRLFQNGLSANILLAQNISIGFIYWGNLFYIPLYFQNVRGWSPETAGILLLPMVLSHAAGSTISGIILSRSGHYKPVVVGGALIWTAATFCKAWYGFHTPIWVFIVVGIIEGLGVGFCFQPGLVGLLAHSLRADRAVMTGLRNFTRAVGGVVGLVGKISSITAHFSSSFTDSPTVSGAILSNILQQRLGHLLSSSQIQELTSSVFGISHLDLPADVKEVALRAYLFALQTVFTLYCPLMALSFLSSLFITDNGMAEKKDPALATKTVPPISPRTEPARQQRVQSPTGSSSSDEFSSESSSNESHPSK